MAEDPRVAEYTRIKDTVAPDLLKRPGVNGVGIGNKRVGGEDTGELAIVVFVSEKRDVPSEEAVPTEISGAPTDVVELTFEPVGATAEPPHAPGPPEADPGYYDPLIGGISMGPARKFGIGGYGFGTLGCIVADVQDGTPLMLSVYHVMCDYDGQAQVGDQMCQPALPDANWDCHGAGTLTRWSVGNVSVSGVQYGVEVAVAAVAGRGSTRRTIAQLGNLTGTRLPDLYVPVMKRGRTTLVTSGAIVYVNVDYSFNFGPPYGWVDLANVFIVRSDDGNPFCAAGDSGSVIVDANRRAVGLVQGATDSYCVGIVMDAALQGVNAGL